MSSAWNTSGRIGSSSNMDNVNTNTAMMTRNALSAAPDAVGDRACERAAMVDRDVGVYSSAATANADAV